MRWFSFLIIFFSFLTNADAFEQVDIFVDPNTSVHLSPVLLSPQASVPPQKEDKKHFFKIGNLALAENSRLIIDNDIYLSANQIFMKPKSVIQTLGHSLVMKAKEFIPGDLVGGTDREKQASMGLIDTSPVEYDPRVGKEGRDGDAGSEARMGIGTHIENIRKPEVGQGGEEGRPGSNGGDAGSFSLIVKHFRGAYINATGGNGEAGGNGGKGGRGGGGYVDQNERQFGTDTSETSVFSGAKGGNGGDGGLGGNGGNGGNVTIQFETKADTADEFLFVLNEGGNAGERGLPGEGGEGGLAGKLMRVKTDNKWISLEGFPGKKGASGKQGKMGIKGKNGAFPKFQQSAYEEN